MSTILSGYLVFLFLKELINGIQKRVKEEVGYIC